MLDLEEKFGERLLVGDGAVGTLLGDRGIAKPHTKANLTHPQIVQELHEEYLRAGSSVIETNTFGANRLKLATHGLEEQVREINVEGARLALEATKTVTGSNGSQALVMGSIGPLGKPLVPIGFIEPGEAKDIFAEQAEALLEGGAGALILETFTDLEELKIAYEAAASFGAPVLAYKTFIEDGEQLAEGLPARVAREISSWGSASSGPVVIGTNCTVGPQRMLEIVDQMSAESGPVAAYPNPGLPQFIHGTIRYNQDVSHFAEYGVKLAHAGARLIGGCCGTTPAHVRALADALRDFEPNGGVTQRAAT
ncbi:MAG TPA: homocysteine S-methyltransferase family protein, partial [Rubrobacteraceae bacterium]|nr:homocysteine S-methyltransferase family protein [Rubrobacteraceae bacterium]